MRPLGSQTKRLVTLSLRLLRGREGHDFGRPIDACLRADQILAEAAITRHNRIDLQAKKKKKKNKKNWLPSPR